MIDDKDKCTREFQLLLTCAKVSPSPEDEATIRRMLSAEIDWIVFARKAIDQELAVLAGHTLARVAPDMVPDDILDAFQAIIDQTRRRNRGLFLELAGVVEALASDGVEAIPFKGPLLAIEAYGDLGLRMVGGLHVLIRDADILPT